MRVIILVTAVAHHRQFDLVLYLVFMTGKAINALVFTVEWKIRLRIVIKLPSQPVIGTVTQFALRT